MQSVQGPPQLIQVRPVRGDRIRGFQRPAEPGDPAGDLDVRPAHGRSRVDPADSGLHGRIQQRVLRLFMGKHLFDESLVHVADACECGGVVGGIGFALFSALEPLTDVVVSMQFTRSLLHVVPVFGLLIVAWTLVTGSVGFLQTRARLNPPVEGAP